MTRLPAIAAQDKCTLETRTRSFLNAFRKHGSQQVVADALQAIDGDLHLPLVFLRYRVLYVDQLADHLADGDLALLLMSVRLDGIIPGQLRKRDHVCQRGLRLRAVAHTVEPVGAIQLQFRYMNAQWRTTRDVRIGDPRLQFL